MRETKKPPLRHTARKLWFQTSAELRIALAIVFWLTVISVGIFKVGMGLSLVDAIYYVITTLTTTGYGDITPREASVWLKLYACFVMILGSASIAILYSIVTDYIVSARLQQFVGGQRVPDAGHVIVVGVGDVGFRVINELERMGAKLVVVDADVNAPHLATVRSRAPVVIGDARDAETLMRAGVDRAIAVVATTQDDAVNLSIGLAAEGIRPEVRSVLRLFDGNFANKVQSVLNIDAAMSASRIAAPAFVSAALHEEMKAAFVLHGRLFSIVKGSGGWDVHVDSSGRISREGSGTALRIEVKDLPNVDPARTGP
jgi:voltage-gated potassium channel Kch